MIQKLIKIQKLHKNNNYYIVIEMIPIQFIKNINIELII